MNCPACRGMLYRPVPEKGHNPDHKCIICGREYTLLQGQLIPIARFATNEDRTSVGRRQSRRKSTDMGQEE